MFLSHLVARGLEGKRGVRIPFGESIGALVPRVAYSLSYM